MDSRFRKETGSSREEPGHPHVRSRAYDHARTHCHYSRTRLMQDTKTKHTKSVEAIGRYSEFKNIVKLED